MGTLERLIREGWWRREINWQELIEKKSIVIRDEDGTLITVRIPPNKSIESLTEDDIVIKAIKREGEE